MTKAKIRPLVIGDPVPSMDGRTDEGTPIALSDFEGRTMALFLVGSGLNRTHKTIMKNIKKRVNDFLEFECSPIVISGEPEEILAAFREMEKLPFLIISDPGLRIHQAMCGKKTEESPGSWLVNENGEIAAMVPLMPPREQVSATLAALVRTFGQESR